MHQSAIFTPFAPPRRINRRGSARASTALPALAPISVSPVEANVAAAEAAEAAEAAAAAASSAIAKFGDVRGHSRTGSALVR